jgi:hypothetical protein
MLAVVLFLLLGVNYPCTEAFCSGSFSLSRPSSALLAGGKDNKPREKWPRDRFLKTFDFFQSSKTKNKPGLLGFVRKLMFKEPQGVPPPPMDLRRHIAVIGVGNDPATDALLQVLSSNDRNAVDFLKLVDDDDSASSMSGVTTINKATIMNGKVFSNTSLTVTACIICSSALKPELTDVLGSAVRQVMSTEGDSQSLFSSSDLVAWRAWGPLDDIVMGGVSDSAIVTEASQSDSGDRVLFKGKVSTANNGGDVIFPS